MDRGNYNKMGLMLIASFVIMYGVMFLNVASADHIYLSLTRTYMTLMMVAPMALMMLLMMKKMYPDKRLNAVIMLLSVVVFSLSLVLLRTQTFVSDRQYMKAMIPHHSSAILTSKNAHIQDTAVKRMAEGIIESQEKEISEMKAVLKRLDD